MTRRIVGVVVGVVICMTVGAARVVAQSGRTTVVVGVTDQTTGSPLAGAQVRVRGIYTNAFTDSTGRAGLHDLEAGRYTLEVRRIGYAPASAKLEVKNQDTLAVIVMLEPLPQRLSTVTVIDSAIPPRLRDFEERRRRGTGRYITGAQIEAMMGANLNSVLARHIAGIRVRASSDGGLLRDFVLSDRGYNAMGSDCHAVTFLDGVMLTDGDVSFINPSELGGIEWYTPGTIPAQYQVANVSGPLNVPGFTPPQQPTSTGSRSRQPSFASAAFDQSRATASADGQTPGRPDAGTAACGVLLLWSKP